MIPNYLLAAIRNFLRNKLHAAITLPGLSLGLMTSLLALMFVVDENSFDTFHSRLDRMYRLNKHTRDKDGNEFNTAGTSGRMGPTMVEEFPEAERVVRYQPW